jgi:hypothetical protein
LPFRNVYTCQKCKKHVPLVEVACSKCSYEYDERSCYACPRLICKQCMKDTMSECRKCEAKLPMHEMIKVENTWVCRQCAKESVSQCSECSTLIFKEHIVTAENKGFCKSCFEAKFIKCPVCHKPHRKDKTATLWFRDEEGAPRVARTAYEVLTGRIASTPRAVTITEYKAKSVCLNCAKEHGITCFECKRVVYQGHMTSTDGKYLCHECRSKYYVKCNKCSRDMKVGTEYRDKVLGATYCHACIKAQSPKGLNQYGEKPVPLWFGEGDHSTLYMGFELEIEVPQVPKNADCPPDVEPTMLRDYLAKYLSTDKKFKKLIYCKTDSSLSYGIEIVTHPFTYEWMMGNIPILEAINALREYKCSSFHNSTCGFHVHLNKSAFSTLQLYKFMRFIYNNPAFSTRISQRTSTESMRSYASLDGLGHIVQKAKTRRESHRRHTAVNLTAFTAEVRIFKGNLSTKRILKNLEFCHALYEYSRHSPLLVPTAKQVPLFSEYVHKNVRLYPNLDLFIRNKGKKDED